MTPKSPPNEPDRATFDTMPRVLRSFASDEPKERVRRGDDDALDGAAAALSEEHGGDDPLYYDFRGRLSAAEDEASRTPRGVGNTKAYLPPTRLGARPSPWRATFRRLFGSPKTLAAAALLGGVVALLTIDRGPREDDEAGAIDAPSPQGSAATPAAAPTPQPSPRARLQHEHETPKGPASTARPTPRARPERSVAPRPPELAPPPPEEVLPEPAPSVSAPPAPEAAPSSLYSPIPQY